MDKEPLDPKASLPAEEISTQSSVGAVSTAPKFCTRCGAPRQADWVECPHCNQRRIEAARAGGSGLEGRGQRLSIKAPLVLYFLLLATSAVGIAWRLLGAAEIQSLLLIGAADTVIVLLWAAFSWRSLSGPLTRLGNPLWYLLAPVFGTGTFLLATGLVQALISLLPGVEEILVSEPFLNAGYGWGVLLLVICFQPAIIEEIAFRGIILSDFQRVLSVREAIILSSLLFMVLHLAVLSFPHLLLMGLLLGWVRMKSKSLYPCMVFHFTHNLLVTLAEVGG